MIRALRLAVLQSLLVLGLLAAGSVGPGHAHLEGARAVAATLPAPLLTNTTPAVEPDDSKLSQWLDGDDEAIPQTAVRIVWPDLRQPLGRISGRSLAQTTHPACAFPPRAPPFRA